jgi:predicted CopG family antitoxin
MIDMKHVSMRQNGYKIIVVSPENHQKLTDMGRKRETFNDIISELIELRKNAIRSEPSLEAGLTPLSGAKGVIISNG